MKRLAFLATLLAVGLAGCGKEEPRPAAAPATSTAPSPATAAAPAPSTTPAPAPSDVTKEAAKAPSELPKVEAPKADSNKDSKK